MIRAWSIERSRLIGHADMLYFGCEFDYIEKLMNRQIPAWHKLSEAK